MKTELEHHVLLHPTTLEKTDDYLAALRNNCIPGSRLGEVLAGVDPHSITSIELVNFLMDTRIPQIFAESAVRGDGSDWTQFELSILGDISVAVPVQIFDDGRHHEPAIHDDPFPGTLLYTAGALLRNGHDCTPPDWNEVVKGESIDQDAFSALYERRLLPPLLYASETAGAAGRRALVTIPGLGCGQFAGPFIGTLGPCLEAAISSLLLKHDQRLCGIQAIYYDPYAECDNARVDIGPVTFMVRPLTRGNEDKPQLCRPGAYQEQGDDFSGCDLFSVVAWDHVSWPGNDFYIGSRATDDGVKAAATNSMCVLTGVEGQYQKALNQYQPPTGFDCWADVVEASGVKLGSDTNILVRG